MFVVRQTNPNLYKLETWNLEPKINHAGNELLLFLTVSFVVSIKKLLYENHYKEFPSGNPVKSH